MEEIQETRDLRAGALSTMEQNNRLQKLENWSEETVNHYWTKTIKIAKEALK